MGNMCSKWSQHFQSLPLTLLTYKRCYCPSSCHHYRWHEQIIRLKSSGYRRSLAPLAPQLHFWVPLLNCGSERDSLPDGHWIGIVEKLPSATKQLPCLMEMRGLWALGDAQKTKRNRVIQYLRADITLFLHVDCFSCFSFVFCVVCSPRPCI